MFFYYNAMFSKHWDLLANMLENVYGIEETANDTILLGCYVHEPVTNIRKEIRSRGEDHGGKLVVYQTEPLVNGHWWKIDQIVNNIRDADEIWDYDIQNIQILKSYGINAKFKPPSYTESLLRVDNREEPDIDVLFYGTITPYRYEIINNVIGNAEIPFEHSQRVIQTKFMFLYNVMDSTLDDLIGRSKIILNINPYEGECRQQQTRIFYPLINNKCVLSQRSTINYYDDLIVEYDDWVDLFKKMIYLLDDDRWKQYTTLDYKTQSLKMRKKVEEIISYE